MHEKRLRTYGTPYMWVLRFQNYFRVLVLRTGVSSDKGITIWGYGSVHGCYMGLFWKVCAGRAICNLYCSFGFRTHTYICNIEGIHSAMLLLSEMNKGRVQMKMVNMVISDFRDAAASSICGSDSCWVSSWWYQIYMAEVCLSSVIYISRSRVCKINCITCFELDSVVRNAIIFPINSCINDQKMGEVGVVRKAHLCGSLHEA